VFVCSFVCLFAKVEQRHEFFPKANKVCACMRVRVCVCVCVCLFVSIMCCATDPVAQHDEDFVQQENDVQVDDREGGVQGNRL
jgi:hypothetical protein